MDEWHLAVATNIRYVFSAPVISLLCFSHALPTLGRWDLFPSSFSTRAIPWENLIDFELDSFTTPQFEPFSECFHVIEFSILISLPLRVMILKHQLFSWKSLCFGILIILSISPFEDANIIYRYSSETQAQIVIPKQSKLWYEDITASTTDGWWSGSGPPLIPISVVRRASQTSP